MGFDQCRRRRFRVHARILTGRVKYNSGGLRFLRLNLEVNSGIDGILPANHIERFKYDQTGGRHYELGQDVIRTPYAEYMEINHFKVPPTVEGGGIVARSSGGIWEVRVPHWLAAAACAALPLLWVVVRVGGRRSRRPGVCRGCGYDLRASPERCPECGARTPTRDDKASANREDGNSEAPASPR